MANKLRASGQIQDKDRYISISEAKRQMVDMLEELHNEIMKMPTIDICPYAIDNCIDRIDVEILVKEKINKLKEVEESE